MTSISRGASNPSERLHALDALRAIALLLGLLVHGGLAFLPGASAFWFTHDAAPSAALSVAFYVPHMFRMLLFFLVAGFFGRMSLERLGVRAFAWDRVRRVTLVLVAFWPLVMAALVASAIFAASRGDPSPPPRTPSFTPSNFPLTHLWFLYVLTLCYIVALACRWLLVRLDRRQFAARVCDGAARFLTGAPGPVILALPLAAALSMHQGWLPWFGIPTPDTSLYPNLAACVAFGSAFGFGWCLHRQPQLLQRWVRHWPFHLIVAASATAGCVALWGLSPSFVVAKPGAPAIVYAVLYAWGGWSWTAGLVGLALRYLSAPSRPIRYLADASYWIYLVHLPLVITVQAFTVHLQLPAAVKFAIVLACVLGVSLPSYQLLVRGSWIGKWLNGRRRP